MRPVTYHGPHGAVTYHDGQLTVTGELPWLITHPQNAAAAMAAADTSHEALMVYLRHLHDIGVKWEQDTRALQAAAPVPVDTLTTPAAAAVKLHERTLMVQRASVRIREDLEKLQARYGLTDVEVLRILNHHQDTITKYMLRTERHPDDPSKKAGEA